MKIPSLSITFSVVILLSLNIFAVPQKNLSCSDIENAKNKSGFITMSQMSQVKDLKGHKLLITSAQVARSLEILDVDDITQTDEYYYKLSLFGKKYDAINIDMGDNSHTLIFKENTSIQMNFEFQNGEMHINNQRCENLELPGHVQF